MWAVVHFLNDNSVEVVPICWLKKDKLCAWPNNSYAAKKMSKIKVKVNRFEFKYYRVRILSNNISPINNINSIGKHPKSGLLTSTKTHNKIQETVEKSTSLNQDALDSSNSDSNGHYSDDYTIPGSKKKREIFPKSDDPYLNNVQLPNLDLVVKKCSDQNINEVHAASDGRNDILMNTLISQNNIFQKSVNSYLAYLKIEVNKISDTQQEILQLLSYTPSHYSVESTMVQEEDYFISSWPISNHEDLNTLESKLSNIDFRKKVVLELARVGGKSLNNMLHKIMRKVLTDKVLTDFTYYGKRNKYNFSALGINKAIFDAVRKSVKFKDSSDDAIITIIGKFFNNCQI